MDGHCSGAIVFKNYKGGGDYRQINYNMNFPFEDILKNEIVVIVDFSLEVEKFKKLLKITDNIIWIDHHQTAIEKYKDFPEEIDGIRRDGISACELTWEYFFPEIPIPKVVKLLGDYDLWKFKYGEETKKFQSGIRLFETYPNSREWNKWLNPDYEPEEEIRMGEIALKYRDNFYKGLIKAFSFFTFFEGYKAIACNAGSVSSQLFDSVEEDFDIMITFVFDGKVFIISLYSY